MISSETIEEYLEECFYLFDQNEDQKITKDELKNELAYNSYFKDKPMEVFNEIM